MPLSKDDIEETFSQTRRVTAKNLKEIYKILEICCLECPFALKLENNTSLYLVYHNKRKNMIGCS